MRKITKFPKTKAQYYRCHYKMWDEIVRVLEETFSNDFFPEVWELKKDALCKCFSNDISMVATCFLCMFVKDDGVFNSATECWRCPLDSCGRPSSWYVLLQDNLGCSSYSIYSKRAAIKYAKKIRDCVL